MRVIGSLALALCHLADGRVDAVASLRPNGARSIDIAAAQLAVREAGTEIALPDAPGPFTAAPLDLVGRSRVVAARDEACVARVAALLGIGPHAGRPWPHPGLACRRERAPPPTRSRPRSRWSSTPNIRRNVVELGMVDAVDVDGGHVHVTIRLTIPGCPLKSNLEAQVRMHVGAVPGVGDRDDRLHAHGRGAARGVARATSGRRPNRRRAPDRGRRANPGDRRGLRQGRCRQVVPDRQPRARAARAGPRGRSRRRRHLRLLDPGHARHPAAPGRGRQDDRAARGARPQGDVHRVLPGRRRLGGVARPDAPPRARAVPVRRVLGAARLPPDRHAAGNRRRRPLARPAAPPFRGRARDDAAAPQRSAWPNARRRWSPSWDSP